MRPTNLQSEYIKDETTLFLFIYFVQGRSENHFCDNAPCLKIIIIIIIITIIIIIIVIIIITLIIWLFVNPRNWTSDLMNKWTNQSLTASRVHLK